MKDSSSLCMPSCKCPVFDDACLGFILFHTHRKNPSFFDLGIFTSLLVIPRFLPIRRSATGSDSGSFLKPSDCRFSICHAPQLAANALRSIGRGARTALFLVNGKPSRKRISYYAKKPGERKERLIDMVIL